MLSEKIRFETYLSQEKIMTHVRTFLVALAGITLIAAASWGQTAISVGISGPGAVNDSTIKVGQPVSVDIYWSNKDDDRRGFTTGFRISSETIKSIKHWPDSGKGFTWADSGKVIDTTSVDVRAHSGWEGTNTWDFTGIRQVPIDWDGNLPDTIGFGGLVVKSHYGVHDKKKVLSWTMVVPQAGMIVVDSTYFRPGGVWAIVGVDAVEIKPAWGGPYKFKVVE
jgi:hypothetical protein